MVRQRRQRPSSLEPDTPTPSDQPSLGERIWDNVGKIGKDLPEGMEPKGNGWYGSPDVIDPRDCANWESSIWCGGNPMSDPRGGIELNLDWGANECGVWASAQGQVFGLGLPTHTRAWVKEECRQDYERKELDRKHPPPEPPPDWSNGNWNPEPQYRPSGFRMDDQVCVVVCDSVYRENQEWHGDNFGWAIATYFSTGTAEECNYPGNIQIARYLFPSQFVTATCNLTGSVSNFNTANAAWVWAYRLDAETKATTQYPPPAYSDTYTANKVLGIPYDLPNGSQFVDSSLNFKFRGHMFTGDAGVVNLGIFFGQFGDIFPNYQLSGGKGIFEGKDQFGRTIERRLTIYHRQVMFCVKADGSKPPKRPHRDSPPPPPKDCCMQCCGSQSQRDPNDDLAKILKELKDIKRVIGYEEYPVKVPATFNRELRENGSRVDPPVIQIQNLTQLQGWQIRVLDAILGDWEVGFEMKDLDPTKEGDQPGRIIAPNISGLLTEMFSLVFDMWLMQYQQVHMMQRHATETMLSKKVAVQNNFLLDAIADYLGFHREEKTKKIQFLFSLDAEKLEDFIKNGEKEILIQEYHPDKKKNPSFKDEMLIMRMMASVIKAIHTRKFDVNGDIPSQLLNHFTKLSENTEKVNKDSYKTGESDFDQWLREAENAFVNKDPMPTDPTKPYGVPLDQRPRLKKITDSTPDDPTTGG